MRKRTKSPYNMGNLIYFALKGLNDKNNILYSKSYFKTIRGK